MGMQGMLDPTGLPGQHYVPQAIFRNRGFPSGVVNVFNAGVTGTTINHGYGAAHEIYNAIIDKQLNGFMSKSGISAAEMTPELAAKFLAHVEHNPNAFVKAFNKVWKDQANAVANGTVTKGLTKAGEKAALDALVRKHARSIKGSLGADPCLRGTARGLLGKAGGMAARGALSGPAALLTMFALDVSGGEIDPAQAALGQSPEDDSPIDITSTGVLAIMAASAEESNDPDISSMAASLKALYKQADSSIPVSMPNGFSISTSPDYSGPSLNEIWTEERQSRVEGAFTELIKNTYGGDQ